MGVDKRDSQIKQSNRISYVLAFLGDIGIGLSSFATSVYTYYLAQANNFSSELTTFWVALVATGWALTYIFSPIVFGYISDKIGRKISLQIALLGFAASNLFITLYAYLPLHLFIANLFSGAFYGFFWPSLASHLSETGEIQGKDVHDTNISKFFVSWSIGLTIGPILGISWMNPVIPFIILIFVSLIGFALTSIFILPKDEMNEIRNNHLNVENKIEVENKGKDPNSVNKDKDPNSVNKENRIKQSHLRFIFIAILCAGLFFSLNNQILFTIFPAYAINNMNNNGFILSKLEIKSVAAVLVFFLGIGRTITFYVSGKLSDQLKEKMILISLFGQSSMMYLIYIISNADALLFIFIIYGLFSGLSFSIGEILLLNLAKKGKGLKSGLYESIVGVGFFFSTFVSQFIGQINPASPFLFGSISTIIGFCILFTFWIKK